MSEEFEDEDCILIKGCVLGVKCGLLLLVLCLCVLRVLEYSKFVSPKSGATYVPQLDIKG